MKKRWYTVMYTDGFDPGGGCGASWSGGFKHVKAEDIEHAIKLGEEKSYDDSGEPEGCGEVFAVFDGLIYPSWSD